MKISLPFHLKEWINLHRNELKPPVGNKVIWANETFIVMVVGGPNVRTDFHVNSTEELFYQLEGDMTLRVMVENEPKDIPIKEGEIFLLPPMIPHSPQRPKDTVGFLVETIRPPEQKDTFRWYCKQCHHPLYEEQIHVNDIEKQLSAVFQRFYSHTLSHLCSSCGTSFNA